MARGNKVSKWARWVLKLALRANRVANKGRSPGLRVSRANRKAANKGHKVSKDS